MVRYLIYMSYIGSRYRGAAKQIGSERLIDIDTIQGALETCLFNNIRPRSVIKPLIYTSSRTDAGVHALSSTVHVDLEHPDGELYDVESVLAHSNMYFARCGHEIRMHKMIPMTNDFHSRASAKSREYIYRFSVAKNYNEHRLPIAELGRSWNVRGTNIDIDALKDAIPLFMGSKNFETFAGKNKTNRQQRYVRQLNTLKIEETTSLMPLDPLSDNFQFYQITVAARSFLYNQVRRIVGALIAVASGRITKKDILFMLQVPNNGNWISCVPIAPAQGLYLKSVNYDEELLQKCTIKHEPISKEMAMKRLSSIN